MSDAEVRRQLKIKSASIQRILKELNMYKKEEEEQGQRVNKYIADDADKWDIKTQQKLLAESKKMIPETQKRLETAVSELQDLVARTAFTNDEDLAEAKEALGKAGVRDNECMT